MRNVYGTDIEVELIPGSGGVYIVSVDDTRIFSKKVENRFPAEGEILRLLR